MKRSASEPGLTEMCVMSHGFNEKVRQVIFK